MPSHHASFIRWHWIYRTEGLEQIGSGTREITEALWPGEHQTDASTILLDRTIAVDLKVLRRIDLNRIIVGP